MTLEKTKTEILNWKDFYGGDIIDAEAVKSATTKKELADIMEKHRNYMEDMLCDALSNLDEFKGRIGLRKIF